MLVLTNAWLAMRYCRWFLQYGGGFKKWSQWKVPLSDGGLLPPGEPAPAAATAHLLYVPLCVLTAVSVFWFVLVLASIGHDLTNSLKYR